MVELAEGRGRDLRADGLLGLFGCSVTVVGCVVALVPGPVPSVRHTVALCIHPVSPVRSIVALLTRQVPLRACRVPSVGGPVSFASRLVSMRTVVVRR